MLRQIQITAAALCAVILIALAVYLFFIHTSLLSLAVVVCAAGCRWVLASFRAVSLCVSFCGST